jgi:hypothetical protein
VGVCYSREGEEEEGEEEEGGGRGWSYHYLLGAWLGCLLLYVCVCVCVWVRMHVMMVVDDALGWSLESERAREGKLQKLHLHRHTNRVWQYFLGSHLTVSCALGGVCVFGWVSFVSVRYDRAAAAASSGKERKREASHLTHSLSTPHLDTQSNRHNHLPPAIIQSQFVRGNPLCVCIYAYVLQ